MTYYILDENGDVQVEQDVVTWSKWLQTANRKIGENHFGPRNEIHVSTVFLGWPYVPTAGRCMFYETMVFAEDAVLHRLTALSESNNRSLISQVFGGIDIQERYATKEEAMVGHKLMCNFVEVCIAKGVLGL